MKVGPDKESQPATNMKIALGTATDSEKEKVNPPGVESLQYQKDVGGYIKKIMVF